MDATALRVAIDLVQVPSRVRHCRSEPLPDGVLTLLRISAGEEDVEIAAADTIGRPRSLVRAAAAFFIEQILLGPDTDSYRVLGTDRSATATELRRNMALLLRWLHPDMDQRGVRSLFAARVTHAWETLKTPDRRADYDAKLSAREASARGRARARQKRAQASAKRLRAWRGPPRGFLQRAMSLLLGGRY